MTLDRRHFACRDKQPHTNGLLLAVKSSAPRTDSLLGNPYDRVPHPLHPVKQQSAFPRTSSDPVFLNTLAITAMVEPTGIEPVTSSLQS
jgi:hypothetical protein